MTNLELISRHQADTGMCSVMHHARQVSTTYDQIIEKGWDIIPDILYYLEEYHGGMHVMMLLMHITGERPYKPAVHGHWNVTQCREAWIQWGKQKYSNQNEA